MTYYSVMPAVLGLSRYYPYCISPTYYSRQNHDDGTTSLVRFLRLPFNCHSVHSACPASTRLRMCGRIISIKSTARRFLKNARCCLSKEGGLTSWPCQREHDTVTYSVNQTQWEEETYLPSMGRRDGNAWRTWSSNKVTSFGVRLLGQTVILRGLKKHCYLLVSLLRFFLEYVALHIFWIRMNLS